MPVIKFNNNLIEFDRIVAYGCSFTAGGELADRYLLPNKTLEEVELLKKELGQDSFNLIPEVKKNGAASWSAAHGKTLAWPAKLSKLFGVPCENRAIGGTSIQSVVYLIEEDLAIGNIRSSDLTIVGITGPNRWMYFDNNGEMHGLMTGYDPKDWPSKRFYNDYITHIANDYNYIYGWFNSIKYIDMLSDRLNGKILQQPCLSKYSEHTRNDRLEHHSLGNIIKHMTSFNSIIDHNNTLWDMMEDRKDTHTWNHPKEIYHQKFAEHLFKILKNE